ncbi:SRPBCC family protein [Yinghuangia soli]|uniref:SRPBCC family protein n=1 Tax=Yinghuangia soli TaxID=2908204 RepID=A0AA41U2Z6_9ACTN|nr:SRPBCC family protein [Yinghuangia soli]MCF2531255.1 SRPBCC family protein [Yinghuangia soli]
MAVLNIHERLLPGKADEVGALLDTLSGPDDRLWPRDAWPRMVLDGPLEVGASGGHGPIRYLVSAYVPGQWVRFAFTGPRGFEGFHEFTVHPISDETTVLRHTVAMRTRGPARLSWPLVFRPLHDACVEDGFDCAAHAVLGRPVPYTSWSHYVRFLRALLRRRPAAEARTAAA